MTTLDTLRSRAEAWLLDDPDPQTRAALQAVLNAGDEVSLREGFAARLEFGTAGLRGVLGPGPGRMNRALVRRVTRGLADALLARDPSVAARGVVVGADARHLSPEFADDVSQVLVGAGIRVHRFEGPAATPVIAWLQARLGAAAAVMVTASHNPPEYNGYKVYVDRAAQIIPPLDREISEAIDHVGPVREIPMGDPGDPPVDPVLLEEYYAAILKQRRHPELDVSSLRVVFTPLHGVGGRYVREAMGRAGYAGLELVSAQEQPDPDFPTVRFPNPEEPGALDLAMETAKGADLILANDPDADRLAVAVPDPSSATGWYALTGNEIGCLLARYLLEEGEVESPLVMTTIVSSRLLSRMARELGAHYDETLTGFKWIAHRSREYREQHGWRLVLGYEEALGYTVGETVGDKDGISAALLFAEFVAFAKSRGRDILMELEDLYRKFGLHRSLQHSLVHDGPGGVDRIQAIMDRLRTHPPAVIGPEAVTRVIDWKDGHAGLPPSNVLGFELEGGGRILVRPSGTEPKIKFYLETVLETGTVELGALRETADRELHVLLDSILEATED